MTRISIRLAATALAFAALHAHAATVTAKVSFSDVVTSASVGIGTPTAGETINGTFTVTADPAFSGRAQAAIQQHVVYAFKV